MVGRGVLVGVGVVGGVRFWSGDVAKKNTLVFSFLGGTVVVKTWQKKKPHDRVRGFAKVDDETLDDVLYNERTDSLL